MRTLNTPANRPPDVDSEDALPRTCLCGHAEEWHQPVGAWCEGPCEYEGCPCEAYRDFEDKDEGDSDGL